jgi:hypothetical protein
MQRVTIELLALTLIDHRTIPAHTVCLEAAQNRVRGARDGTRFIHIFDADKPPASGGACVKITGDGRDQRSKM